MPLTELEYEFGYSLAIQLQAKDALWSVQTQEGFVASKEERMGAQAKLRYIKVESWPIADQILTIRDSKGLSGVTLVCDMCK